MGQVSIAIDGAKNKMSIFPTVYLFTVECGYNLVLASFATRPCLSDDTLPFV